MEDAADPENASMTSKTTPATSPRELFGNPKRLAMDASSIPGVSVTFVTSGFHISLPP